MSMGGTNPQGNFGAADSGVGGGGGGGTITTVTSADGTIAVLNPGGPVVDLSAQTSPIVDFIATVTGAAVTSIDVVGLNAGTIGVPGGEGDYLVDGQILSVGSNNLFAFRINGATVNLRARKGDALVGSSFAADWGLANTVPYPLNGGVRFTFSGKLTARSGRVRKLNIQGLTNDGNNDYLFLQGEYTDTVTNVASFGLVGSTALGTGIGTYIRLTPLYTDK